MQSSTAPLFRMLALMPESWRPWVAELMWGINSGGDARRIRFPTAASPEWEKGARYRTMLFATINWDNPYPYDILFIKSVHPTTLYRNGALIDTKTASRDGMAFTDFQHTAGSAYAQVRFVHEMDKPYCMKGSINYNVLNRFYRSGTIETVGWRYPVPNHEIYARRADASTGNANTWFHMAWLDNKGFVCLTGACGTESVNYHLKG